MPGISITFGIILILQGVITYAISAAGHKSFTAFIPSIVGALLLVCGLIAKNPNMRKHAMHAAAMVGLLGALMGLGRGLMKVATGAQVNLAIGSALAMGVICAIFVILCIRSFIAARKAREATTV